jgi:hypothetical protein
MNAEEWISSSRSIAEIVAIAGAGVWGYWNYVRGRTFHYRADLTIAASVVTALPDAIRATATLKNTGASEIPLRVAEIRVFAFQLSGEWLEVGVGAVFRDHEWLESKETLSDDVLITVDINPVESVLRAKCTVVAKKRMRWSRNVAFVTNVIILPAASKGGGSVSKDLDNEKHGLADRRIEEEEIQRIEHEERQRTITEEEIQKIEQDTKEDE